MSESNEMSEKKKTMRRASQYVSINVHEILTQADIPEKILKKFRQSFYAEMVEIRSFLEDELELYFKLEDPVAYFFMYEARKITAYVTRHHHSYKCNRSIMALLEDLEAAGIGAAARTGIQQSVDGIGSIYWCNEMSSRTPPAVKII